MASLIGSAASSGANQNMQNGWGQLQAYADPGNLFGGNSAQAMDPIGYGIANLFGVKSPLQMITDKIPGFQPNPQNQNGGVPSVLPNLGAQSIIPQMPQGGFMPLGQTNPMGGNGGGIFNQMAANSAGQLFSPGYQNPKGASNNQMHADPISMILNKGNPQQGNMGGSFLSYPAGRNLYIGDGVMPRGTYQR